MVMSTDPKLLYIMALIILVCSSTIHAIQLKINTSDLNWSYFENNEGQISNSEVLCFSQNGQYQVMCYKNYIVFFDKVYEKLLRFSFLDSNPIAVRGEYPKISYSCYIQTNNETFQEIYSLHYSSVVYSQLYKGIDLVLFINDDNNYEFDFIVSPQVNPNIIKIDIEINDGQNPYWRRVTPTIDRNCIFLNDLGVNFSIHIPTSFQWIEGNRIERKTILLYDEYITFDIKEYDPNYHLIIDPTLLSGTYLGGSDTDRIYDVVMDQAGNIYVVGETKSTTFPITYNVFQSTHAGGCITGDIFISKLNPQTNTLLFSTFVGGWGDESPTKILLDSDRNIYVFGITSSSNFPITSNALQTIKKGNRDAILIKISNDGRNLLYGTYFGGSLDDCIMDAYLLNDNSVIIGGWTQSNDFYITQGTSLHTSFGGGGLDAFITKLSPTFEIIWSGYWGTSGVDVCQTLSILQDYLVVGGYTSSNLFPITSEVIQPSFGGGNYDSFVSIFTHSNANLVKSTFIGGSSNEFIQSLKTDEEGYIYITGETSSVNFPVTVNAFQIGYGGGEKDAFVSKLYPTLNQFAYSTYLGGSKSEAGLDIVIDGYKRTFVVGYTYSGDFPVVPGTLQPYYGGNQDAFFSCLNPFGNILIYSSYYGGNKEERARSAYISSSNVLCIVGETASNLFPITSGTYQTTFQGGTSDGFISCIDVETPTLEGEGSSEGTSEGSSSEGSNEGEVFKVWRIPPITRTISIGQSTTFIIGIAGFIGTINYQWQFKGFNAEEYVPLPYSNSATYTVRNAQSSSAGYYRCRVTDAQGTVFSQPFTLYVSSNQEGSSEGIGEGEGMLEEGTEEGEIAPEGILEGSIEGTVEGIFEGSITDGETAEGYITEGSGIEEGTMEGENILCDVVIQGTETNVQLMDYGQTILQQYVSIEGVIHDISVEISLWHEDLKQVLIQLISPSGSEIILFFYPQQGGTTLNQVLFDDYASISITEGTSPYTGTYQPVMPLSFLKGQGTQGWWKLRIVDNQTGKHGTLLSWSLIFNSHFCEEGEVVEGEIITEGEDIIYHSADIDKNYRISLSELLRVVQIFNFGGYHCDPLGEDGFALGPGDRNCSYHHSDYMEPRWVITLAELLRLIQFFNLGGYTQCSGTEDGFCPR